MEIFKLLAICDQVCLYSFCSVIKDGIPSNRYSCPVNMTMDFPKPNVNSRDKLVCFLNVFRRHFDVGCWNAKLLTSPCEA